MSARKLFSSAVQTLGALVLIRDHVFEIAQCSGESMEPTFKGRGELLLIDKCSFKRKGLSRGDIIVLTSPTHPGRLICKRIVGMSGDELKVETSRGPFLVEGLVHVPKGHLWIEGDNYIRSHDSRHFGPVPMGLVRGRVLGSVSLQMMLYRSTHSGKSINSSAEWRIGAKMLCAFANSTKEAPPRTDDAFQITINISNSGQKLVIDRFPLLIGRLKSSTTEAPGRSLNQADLVKAPTQTLSINNTFMSRRHAMITQASQTPFRNTLRIIDLGSSNGTFVNGRRIQGNEGVILRDGDLIRFGEDDPAMGKEFGEAVRCRIAFSQGSSSKLPLPSVPVVVKEIEQEGSQVESLNRVLSVYEWIIVGLILVIFFYQK